MISAFFHKICTYALMLVCQFSGHACAYGAVAVAPPTSLNIKLPAGFKITIFSNLAENLAGESQAQPRMMAFDSQGRLYVALASSNSIAMLPDANKDGLAEAPVIIANHLNAPNSIAFIDNNTMLIGNQDAVVKLNQVDGKWSTPKPFISHLPYGHHTLKTVKIGPDGYLYVNVGSSCNVCVESDALRATILRYTLDGKPAGNFVTVGKHATNPIWARGLRNSQGFAWQPKTGAMFATNNGSDDRSHTNNGKVNDDIPPEDLNKIEPGKHYGWPYCWSDVNNIKRDGKNGMVDDQNFLAPDIDFCKTAAAPAITFNSHATPIGITFLDNINFPADFKNDAIVALHGSWNRQVPSGYKLVRVKFNGNNPTEVLDFATGWLNLGKKGQSKAQYQYWGRPVDVIIGPDGALYVSDDHAGVIYRISYQY
ncbi:MAG: PQQ-dependent sugar dehydrogenase [Bdellovibrio sp.]|nr:PQQ-dependent sugar dehydrogenase [Methylotenera sp.]